MKQILRLTLVSLLSLVCGGVFAAVENVDFTALSITATDDGFTLASGDYSFVAKNNNGQTKPTQNPNAKDIRLYAKNTMDVSSVKPMTKMVFKISAQGLKRWAEVTPSVGTVTNDVDNETLTWTSDAAVADVTFTVGDKAVYGTDGASKAGQFDFNSVEITTEDGAVAVASPEFSLEGGVYTEPQTLTLTAGEGCTIYYTENGENPTKESTLYTAPITVDKTMTVKAVAYDAAGNASGIASETYTFPVACENIAAVKAQATGTLVVLTFKDAQVVYVNSYNNNTEYFVRDASGAIDIYNTGLELKQNDILNGTAIFEYSPYNGLPELVKADGTNADNLTVTEGADAQPVEVSVADLLTDKYMCDFVTVKNVNITTLEEGKYNNTYAVDENENKVMLYDKFKLGVNIPTDTEKYDVTGILGTLNESTNEVFLLSIEENMGTGIDGVTVDNSEFDENAPVYNLAGQRVSKNAKGILIQNGKKFIRK